MARELAIPAVVATGRATTELRDGQIVTIDGAAGTVTLVTSASGTSAGSPAGR